VPHEKSEKYFTLSKIDFPVFTPLKSTYGSILGGKIRAIFFFSGIFPSLANGREPWQEPIGIAFRAVSGTIPTAATRKNFH
jgi:hypothetical protein